MKNMDPEQLTKMGISAEQVKSNCCIQQLKMYDCHQAKTLSESVESMDPRTLESLVKWSGRIQKARITFPNFINPEGADRSRLHLLLVIKKSAASIGRQSCTY